MTISVITKEYLDIQKKISSLQDKWKEEVNLSTFEPEMKENTYRNDVPLIVQTSVKIDEKQYTSFINELVELLQKEKPELNEELKKVANLLNDSLLSTWIEHTLSLNHVYFNRFAKDNNIDEWIPFFLAEHALRPYLRSLAKKYNNLYQNNNINFYGCPTCGEPVRLGQIEDDGKKVLHCPRCHTHWQEKKLKCSHCGNEDHETLSYLTVEGNQTEQIHVCKECNGYVKMVDVREALEKLDPSLLDITTLHLDYVAQQQGFGSKTEEKNIKNNNEQ